MFDFDKRFDERRKDFDKQFKRTQRAAYIAWAISTIAGCAGFSFAVWVIVKLMQHFGVI